jgi:hypothetical protein
MEYLMNLPCCEVHFLALILAFSSDFLNSTLIIEMSDVYGTVFEIYTRIKIRKYRLSKYSPILHDQ